LRHATDQAIEGRRKTISIDYAHPVTPPGLPSRWLSMQAQAQYDDNGMAQRVVGLLLNVTEKRQQEAAFKAQQDLLATALEAAAVTVVSYDYATEMITFDHVPNALKPFLPSYPRTALLSSVLKHVHREDLASLDDAMNPHLPNELHTVSIIIRSRPEAPPVWLAIKGQIERTATGQCRTFHGFLIDITRQRLAEVALIDASRLAMIGELATGVAHELRQPLNAIKLAAHNLQRQARTGLDFDKNGLIERLSLITRNIERADRVISALRNLSRKPNSDKIWFDVAETLRELLLLQSDVIREAGVELDLALEDGIRIYGEPHRLEQAVLNLLSNAIHAASRNPDMSRPRLTLSLVASHEQGYLDVVVADNGPGIATAILNNIFTPFMTTKPPAEGMGLGLSIVHSIVVQEFGGTVTAENTGSGALFRIRLKLPAPGAQGRSASVGRA
jgi:signal transduction histidine kinase